MEKAFSFNIILAVQQIWVYPSIEFLLRGCFIYWTCNQFLSIHSFSYQLTRFTAGVLQCLALELLSKLHNPDRQKDAIWHQWYSRCLQLILYMHMNLDLLLTHLRGKTPQNKCAQSMFCCVDVISFMYVESRRRTTMHFPYKIKIYSIRTVDY